jgi:microcystin-dependent protein
MSSTPYDRQYSFALFSAENPGEPHSGATLDAEFNAVKLAVDDTQQNLALIQDDDGALKRGSVGQAQFDASVSIGFGAPSQWASGQIYTADVNTVFYQSKFYIANVTHTSTASFEPAKWDEIADFTLAAVISDGSITSAKLAAGAVTADKIGDGSISAAKLATGAVTANKIADANVTTPKIADASVTLAKLASEVLPAGLGPLPWSGRVAPAGWVLTGGTYSRATYPALWAFAANEIANGNLFYGVGDGVTNFTIASMAGRVPAGREASASKLTSTYFGGDSTKVGANGGLERSTLLTANLPPQTPAGTIGGTATSSLSSFQINTSGNNTYAGGGTGPSPQSNSGAVSVPAAGLTFTGTAFAGQISTPVRTVQPTIIVEFIVKAH